MSGNISGNDAAYANKKLIDVYSSYETVAEDGNITKDEAKNASTWGSSIFNKGSAVVDEKIREAISNNDRLKNKGGDISSVVKRYLGGAATAFSNITFGGIQYNVDHVDEERANEAKTKIDNAINQKISELSTQTDENLTGDFNAALQRAIKSAENQICGDDAVVHNNKVEGKESNQTGFNNRLDNGLRFGTDTDASQAAFFTQASGGSDAAGALGNGYNYTCQYLRDNGAKEFTREVDGQQRTIFKLKGGEHVCVDDAGQVHTLVEIKKNGKNCYVTQEAANALRDQAGDQNATIKRRRVDGEYRAVVMSDDKQSATVVDYDATAGDYTVSSDLTHVSAGGRAKYASGVTGGAAAAVGEGTSSLGAGVRSDNSLSFTDGKVKDGQWVGKDNQTHNTYIRTQRGRARVAERGIQGAVDDIGALARAKGCEFTDDKTNGKATVNIGGIVYTINKNDQTEADAQMRVIRAKLEKYNGGESTEINVTVDNEGWVDEREDANHIGHNSPHDDHDHTGEHTLGVHIEEKLDGSGNVTVTRGGAPVHSLQTHYDNGQILSRAQFRSEGWYTADSQRHNEGSIIEQMDAKKDTSVAANGLSVRNFTNAKEFAIRFLEVKGDIPADKKPEDVYNVDLLAKAIAKANPSIFDETKGVDEMNMYQNADFNRINLPTKLDRFKIGAEQATPVRRSQPVDPHKKTYNVHVDYGYNADTYQAHVKINGEDFYGIYTGGVSDYRDQNDLIAQLQAKALERLKEQVSAAGYSKVNYS